MVSLNTLTDEYAEWNARHGLDLGSADDHWFDESLTREQQDWLRDFSRRWDDAAEAEREAQRPVVSDDKLPIDDDMGTETYIRTIRGPSLLGIRRVVRELNPGRIPIYSDYDCTGLVCWQGCKFLKVYRCYTGFYVAVVEITISRDV